MSQEPQDTPVEERLYAVMTDSHRIGDNTVLARMRPERSRRSGFWTQDSPDDIWLMDRKTADEIVEKLHFNGPRAVRAEKAISLIEAQRVAALSKQGNEKPADEEPASGMEP